MRINQTLARQRKGTRLYCFSPPVMIATFAIEIIAAIYTVWRYRLNTSGKLVVAMLVFLSIFQLSEYFVCGGFGMSSGGWARVGYVAITMLPPLGLHLLYVIGGRTNRRLVAASYATAAAFIVYFLSYAHAFTGFQCTGNYVIFQLAVKSGGAYALYYYGWLLTALIKAARWVNQAGLPKLPKPQHQAINGLRAGYLVFIIPTAIANTINPETRQGIPSIMCGFAVIFALILVAYILPRVGLLRSAPAHAEIK